MAGRRRPSRVTIAAAFIRDRAAQYGDSCDIARWLKKLWARLRPSETTWGPTEIRAFMTDTLAYLGLGSGVVSAADEVASAIEADEDLAAFDHGELDDLIPEVMRCGPN